MNTLNYYDLISHRRSIRSGLHKNNIIRFINVLGLSLLFLLSNTPKKLLHGIFASHVDAKKDIPVEHEGENLVKLEYHCQCDNLVVESPFIHFIHSPVVNFPKEYRKFTVALYKAIPVEVVQFTFLLRGPPITV